MQVAFLVMLMSKAVIKFQMLDNKTTIAQFENTECKGGKSTECALAVGYKKVLFFYNDGLARDLAQGLVEQLSNSSNSFRIQNEGFPASYAVFTSYVTGSAPTNFMGAPILSDNMIHQLVSNDIPLRYYGTRMPAYDVLQAGNYFDKVSIEATTSQSKLYESLFQCSLNDPEECANQFLDSQKDDGDWIKNMEYIKNWVDANPEYLLVIFSDHGGKLKSETAAHGVNNGGNEAFMVVYNPTLKPLPVNKQDKFIDAVDVCSTITQHFVASGASIPAENIGKVAPVSDDPKEIFKTLKLNADQFNRLGKRWGYRMNQKDYSKAIELEDEDTEKAISLFTEYINDLKIPFLNLKRFPIYEVVFFPIIITLLIVSLIKRQYGTIRNLAREFTNNVALVFIPYLVIFGITALFSGFWVLYWHDDNESIHVYAASLLAALLMYYAPKATNNERVLSIDEKESHKHINDECLDPIGTSFCRVIQMDDELYPDPPDVAAAERKTGVEMETLLNGPNSLGSSPDSEQSPSITSAKSIVIDEITNSLFDDVTPHAYEYKVPGEWLIKYALFSFFMADLNFFAGITDHFLPFLVLLMASSALMCYKSMKMNFQIGDVAIYVPGVFDPPSRPVFSGFIMGFHKLGYFFLLGAFLIKVANPCPPALAPRKWFNNSSAGSTTGGAEPIIDIDLGIISLQLYLAILNTANQDSFLDWARDNNKTYASADFQRRYKIYVDNLVYVQNYVNLNPSSTFQLGMTQFADLTFEEFKHIYGSVKNYRWVKKEDQCGWPIYVLEYVKRNQVTFQSEYPYLGYQFVCRKPTPRTQLMFQTIGLNTEDQMPDLERMDMKIRKHVSCVKYGSYVLLD
eukprot:gene12827-15056_t